MRDFHLPGRSTVLATNAMVATSHPLAAQVALDLLRAGGTAADAAVGAAVLLGLCEPQMTGLGGDCFVLIQPTAGAAVQALNGSGRAPAALDAQALRDRGLTAMPLHAPEAVTIPGAVDAFCTLLDAHGRLGLDRVLAPAIHYADEGVPVAPRVAFDWAEDARVLQDAARDLFLFAGQPPRTGQIFRAPGQAEVLRRIARQGRDGFYTGEVARDMVDSLRALGGCHTEEDFAATAATWGDPVAGGYRGADLLEHPPNGQGATAILMLNILSHFDLAALDPLGADRAHLEAEAAKLAYDARNRFLADPDRTTRLAHMLAPETAAWLAALIDPARAMPAAAPLTEAIHRDTIYMTVVDRDRMAVSLIYSIFHGFGSGLASSRFGINFQNRGAGFSLTPGHPNEAAGRRRPMHTIIPGLLRQPGGVDMPFGVMGGAYQPCGHARVVSNLVDYGMDLQQALDAPRCFAGPEGMQIERGYAPAVAQALADRGHAVSVPAKPLGGAQAIRIDHQTGVLWGASDPRKDGCALGY
ncbi:MAG: gamma-glutamyltransferase family protein [Rhodobacterales bacterium]|nr:gamma-glutamyltransferase family protein [Rhodobacterales bacterium]